MLLWDRVCVNHNGYFSQTKVLNSIAEFLIGKEYEKQYEELNRYFKEQKEKYGQDYPAEGIFFTLLNILVG